MQYDYEMFKKDVYALTNINLSLYKEKQMKRRIESLMRRYGYEDFEGFLKGLKKDNQLFDAFINHLTINVSEFYRNPGQWEYFEREILPYLIRRYGKHLKIWSAACSTGDEPYTIAMIMAKHLPLGSFQIYATDIDEAVLKKAQLGIYARRSMTGLPEDFLNHHFHKINQGDFLQISDEIKSCVEFKRHNLLEDEYPRDCHMIVCRNVVIYFTEEAKTLVYQGFHRSLVEDGILFIGSTEQIIDARELGFTSFKSFFYQKIPVGSNETATISNYTKGNAAKSISLDSKGEMRHPAAPTAEKQELRRPAPSTAERREMRHSAAPTAEKQELRRPAPSTAERREMRHPAVPTAEKQELRHPAPSATERREMRHPAAATAEKQELRHPAPSAAERREVRRPVLSTADRREMRHPAPSATERREVRRPAAPATEKHEMKKPTLITAEKHGTGKSASTGAEKKNIGKSGLGTGQKKIF